MEYILGRTTRDIDVTVAIDPAVIKIEVTIGKNPDPEFERGLEIAKDLTKFLKPEDDERLDMTEETLGNGLCRLTLCLPVVEAADILGDQGEAPPQSLFTRIYVRKKK